MSYEEIEVDSPPDEPPINETSAIDDSINRTAGNSDVSIDINSNESVKAPKRLARLKKRNGDGTPVTSKASDNVVKVSTGAKPKKLMDITNTKNDSHDETFKIPMIPVSAAKGSREITFDDLNSADETETEETMAMQTTKYPTWSQKKFLHKMLQKQYYMENEGEIVQYG